MRELGVIFFDKNITVAIFLAITRLNCFFCSVTVKKLK